MKTFEKIFIVLVLLSTMLAKSQQIDWSRINSQTAIDMTNTKNTDPSLLTSSVSQVVQIGDLNNTDLNLNSKTNIIVQQLGDQNSIYFNNSFSSKEAKTAITTQGNNNIVDITGTNSVSDKMHLNVQGENMTVFMRNY